jgi:extracellular factor (EF) 3-hydroxypalmitic acid methyl ester biosynthesis protein
VAELRMLLEDGRQQLDALERQLPWHALHGAQSPVLAALERSLRAGFVPEFVRLTESIDAEIRTLPGGHRNEPARLWAMRNLQEFLMESPGLRRAYEKPFGYPGDYEVMNAIYERFYEGSTLFARSVGLGFSEALCSKAVRFRKDLIKRQLKALISRRAGSEGPVRVLSIGAGPAQELHELFQEVDDLPVPLEVVLFEQDKNALAHSFRRLTPTVEARFQGRVRLLFLHDSIKRLLRDGSLFAPFGKFDLVYSAGLLDYLQQRTGTVLTRHLAGATAPGGQLLVANMVDNPARMLLQVHLDWALIYRTREELVDMARAAVPGARVRILEEESGVNPFFEIVRG